VGRTGSRIGSFPTRSLLLYGREALAGLPYYVPGNLEQSEQDHSPSAPVASPRFSPGPWTRSPTEEREEPPPDQARGRGRGRPEAPPQAPARGAYGAGRALAGQRARVPQRHRRSHATWTLTGGSFLRVLRHAGLSETTRFHDLRHTCATLLLSRGAHVKLVQELLGHATISITLDTYSHVLPGMDDGLADAMDDALG
jgi:hypothetical protein